MPAFAIARLFFVGLLVARGRLDGGKAGRGRCGVSGEEELGVGGRDASIGVAIVVASRWLHGGLILKCDAGQYDDGV